MGAAVAQQLTPKKRERFLAALAECGSVTRAAAAVAVSREAVYRRRRADRDFAAGWDAAVDAAAAVLEEEAFRRAHDGVEEPLTCAKGLIRDADGVPVTVRKYSDTLLIFLLKGARPEKYRENVKVSGHVEHSLIPTGAARDLADELLAAVRDLPDARERLAATLLREGGGEASG